MDFTQLLSSASSGVYFPDFPTEEPPVSLPSDQPLPPAPAGQSSAGWLDVLAGVANKGLDAVKTYQDIKGRADAQRAEYEANQATIALQQQRTQADTIMQAAQIRADQARTLLAAQLSTLQAQGKVATQKAITWLSSPEGLLVGTVAAFAVWKFASR